MTHLYLIRHGEAIANVEPIIGGMRGDRGLTSLGIAQAEHLRDRLQAGEIAADVLIASTLPRARETAGIIAPALGVPVLLDDEVQEVRVGEADALSLDEANTRFGLPDFEREPYRPIAPGGESWAAFLVRVGVALDRITTDHAGKQIVVVCHGGVIEAAFFHFFRLGAAMLPQIAVHTDNASITRWHLHIRPGKPDRWRLIGYNDVTHLRDIGTVEHLHWENVRARAVVGESQLAAPLPLDTDDSPT